jgi:hypothetical protein
MSKPLPGFGFDCAIKALRIGRNVSRYSVPDRKICNILGSIIFFCEEESGQYSPTSDDMLAMDWHIVE